MAVDTKKAGTDEFIQRIATHETSVGEDRWGILINTYNRITDRRMNNVDVEGAHTVVHLTELVNEDDATNHENKVAALATILKSIISKSGKTDEEDEEVVAANAIVVSPAVEVGEVTEVVEAASEPEPEASPSIIPDFTGVEQEEVRKEIVIPEGQFLPAQVEVVEKTAFDLVNKIAERVYAKQRTIAAHKIASLEKQLRRASKAAIVAEPVNLESHKDTGCEIPTLDESFYVAPPHEDFIMAIVRMSARNPVNLALAGPTGCGKTELCKWIAAKANKPFLKINLPFYREGTNILGKERFDGKTYFAVSQFLKAMEAGNHVICLDEFTRASRALHNVIFPFLDGTRSGYIEEVGRIVKVGAGTVFISASNEGAEYAGVLPMDKAMSDRWISRIELGYLPLKAEAKLLHDRTGLDKAKCFDLAEIAQSIRSKMPKDDTVNGELTKGLSTRELLQAAEVMDEMGDIGIMHTAFQSFDSKKDRDTVQTVISGKFPDAVAEYSKIEATKQ